MATNLLGKAALAATTYTTVAQVPANTSATVNIRIVNRDTANLLQLRLAVCPSTYTDGTAPATADYIEPMDLVIPAGGILEDTAIALASGEKVVAYSSTAAATVRVFGYSQ